MKAGDRVIAKREAWSGKAALVTASTVIVKLPSGKAKCLIRDRVKYDDNLNCWVHYEREA